ncbi:MAG: UDP-glucose 4-epimerase GalE [Paracoccaceae bacterium]
MRGTVLVTGGAGFIGAHVTVALIEAGYAVVILDNFENSRRDIGDRLAAMAFGLPEIVAADVRDDVALDRLFTSHRIDAVVHMAGKKAVGESVADPLLYYSANLTGAMTLLAVMTAHKVQRLVFSSSATVYGTPERLPIDEHAPLGPANPYGRTKLMIEQIIGDLAVADPAFSAISLRYFNPVGARRGGLIGEQPRGTPNNLFPYIAQTAAGTRTKVSVFGDDYSTLDGTGVRDYVHVVDLARGHVAAISRLMGSADTAGHQVINLGTGRGYSVLEAITAFERACQRKIPYEIVARRPGDIAACVADPSLAARLLDWRAELGIDDMCADHWAFQRTVAAS